MTQAQLTFAGVAQIATLAGFTLTKASKGYVLTFGNGESVKVPNLTQAIAEITTAKGNEILAPVKPRVNVTNNQLSPTVRDSLQLPKRTYSGQIEQPPMFNLGFRISSKSLAKADANPAMAALCHAVTLGSKRGNVAIVR